MIKCDNFDVLPPSSFNHGFPSWQKQYCAFIAELVKLSDVVAEAVEKVRCEPKLRFRIYIYACSAWALNYQHLTQSSRLTANVQTGRHKFQRNCAGATGTPLRLWVTCWPITEPSMPFVSLTP